MSVLRSLYIKIVPKKIRNLRHLFYAWWGSVKYHHPSEKLLVVGITGTSGKSSTVFFLRQALEALGFKVGSLSTIDFSVAGENKLNDKKMTMLGRMQIQKYLREMVDKKCDVAIVETTSEGAVQYRHRFINYDTIILTNFYPEHIESHGSFENYKKAKLSIFAHVAKGKRKKLAGKNVGKTAIINIGNQYAAEFADFGFDTRLGFGVALPHQVVSKPTEITKTYLAEAVQVSSQGLSFSVEEHRFVTKLFGEPIGNACEFFFNLLAVIATLRSLGNDWFDIQEALTRVSLAPGRLEFITEAEAFGFGVIVDYAFEPVAMTKLYETVKLFSPTRIIHVFGATGGGRDVERRFTVGALVGKQADICIVTNEDPYDDDPVAIMNDVKTAVLKVGKKLDHNLFLIEDRAKAIQYAIDLAEVGDCVLVTGKGSEQAIVVKGELIPWDDREQVRQALQKKKKQ